MAIANGKYGFIDLDLRFSFKHNWLTEFVNYLQHPVCFHRSKLIVYNYVKMRNFA